MSSTISTPSSLLSPDQLHTLNDAEILDENGQGHRLGEMMKGKRTVLIFIRHFWCSSCKAYIKVLSEKIPPSALPEGTSLIVIGNGQATPIASYRETTSCPYPIYTHPSLQIHKSLEFVAKFARPANAGGEGTYEAGLGGGWSKFSTAMTEGLLKNPQHALSIGPGAMNGGEIFIEGDGSCSFFHRMQHSGDHTQVEELAKVIGVQRDIAA